MQTLTRCHLCRCPGEPGADQCARCGRWLVVPDPHPPRFPRYPVGTKCARLWDACRDARVGNIPASAVEGPWRDYFNALDRWRQRRDLPHALRAPVEACCNALLDMYAFIAERDVAILNATWTHLLPAAHELWELSRTIGWVTAGACTSTLDRVQFEHLDD